ncbi:MAG: fused MFS/spermidine synthase, partial [Proteobacteria bacterium]|nr:fused MFS/spermidine synthase [Pseudomonadota bacterium]
QVEIVAGDARQMLEAEPDQAFDVLVLDAFTGDSIPLHLLTVEAFDIYLRHLKPDGQIAVLTDTWHMNFSRAMMALGMHLNLKTVEVTTQARDDENWGAEWFLFSRLAGSSGNNRSVTRRNGEVIDPGPYLLTDDYTSIWNLVSWDEY